MYMDVPLTPENLILLAEFSKKVPDMSFFGTSKAVKLGFKDGFIYVYGTMRKGWVSNHCIKKQGKLNEILFYPLVLERIDAKKQLSNLLRYLNSGIELKMEPHPDLDKMLKSNQEFLTA